MRKYVMEDGEVFEADFKNDIIPALLAQGDKYREDKMNELEEKYPNLNIKYRVCNLYNSKTGEMRDVVYYYAIARLEGIKQYKTIKEYDYDFPPQNPVIEVILQCEDYARNVYVPLDNYSYNFFDLIDNAIEYICENIELYCKYVDKENGYGRLLLFDDGGWELDIEIETDCYRIEDEIKKLITSIRLVEEI